MPYKELWIFVEGNDDERFFEQIRSFLSKEYGYIHRPWKYAQKPKRRIRNFLDSLRDMGASCLFVADINQSTCVTAKKSSLKKKCGARLDAHKVIIVVKEIEGWYLAGLDNRSCKALGIDPVASTDNITKEDFNRLIPAKFQSRIDFMIEVLKRFSPKTARRKNRSFAYFLKKISAE